MSILKRNFGNVSFAIWEKYNPVDREAWMGKIRYFWEACYLSKVYRCHLPPRLESAGRCNAPWLGPGHAAAGAEKLQGTEPAMQKLLEGPPSSCKTPGRAVSYAVALLKDVSRAPVVLSCFLSAAVANPLKTAFRTAESKVRLLFHPIRELSLPTSDQVQLLASWSLRPCRLTCARELPGSSICCPHP